MKKMLWLWVVMWCSLAGTSAEVESTEVLGVLGESFTFKLDSAKSSDTVFWFRNETHVATMSRGPPRKLTPLGTYRGRSVTPSEDYSSLTVTDLRIEDAGKYTAQFLNQNTSEIFGRQIFTLKVYKRLLEADLEVVCKEEIRNDGNKTLHINCSAGKWGDGVGFSWTSPGWKDKILSSETSLVLLPNTQDDDITCVAKNPIGDASRTFSLTACIEGATASTGLSSTTIGVTVAAWIVAKVIINVCVFFVRWSTCSK